METKEIALSRLVENKENPRTITTEKFQKLVKSLLVFPRMLTLRPIVVDETMTVLGGNMRLKALKHCVTMDEDSIRDILKEDGRFTKGEISNLMKYWMGWRKNPTATIVDATDLTEEQKKEFIIKDNVGFGDWDTNELANKWDTNLLRDWGMNDWDFGMSGGELKQDDGVSSASAQDDDFDQDKEKIKKRCKHGDIWQLGEHRLMCGDSTVSENVQSLMGGQDIDMYLTDPPYNVGYGYEGSAMMSRIKHRTDGLTIANDKMDNEVFRKFLIDAFSSAANLMKKGAAFYIFHSDLYSMYFREALFATEVLELKEVLIWNKDSLCLGRQDYQWKHEPCLYGWKIGAAHSWFGDRKQTTVIDMARPKKSESHPTMKPVPLFAYLMNNSSKEGWNIYDGFGGSGTTLIAAEQLKRKAYLMELDPHYCDVILARWEKLTGKKAELLR